MILINLKKKKKRQRNLRKSTSAQHYTHGASYRGQRGEVQVQPRLEPMAQDSKRNNYQNVRFGIITRLFALGNHFHLYLFC